MRYIGWLVSLLLALALYFGYRFYHEPMNEELKRLKEEITMWESVLKNEKGITGDRNRFAIDRFFQNDKLTPYGEVEILRRFEPTYKSIEIYVSAPHPLARASDVVKFLAEQGIEYSYLSCTIEIDSVERFEYRLSR